MDSYSILLVLHSLFRWLIVISMVYTIVKSFQGWFSNSLFTAGDAKMRTITTSIVHVQFFIGLVLYFVSPLISYFLDSFSTAVKIKDIRFFAMEHSLIMLIAVIVISFGSARSKKQVSDKAKFKSLAIWFLIGFILMFAAVPWPFSPLVMRPWFRFF